MCHVSKPRRVVVLNIIVLTCIISTALGASPGDDRKSEAFRVGKSHFLGWVWNQGHADASIISQDGGLSYAVPGGSLWCFGDTFKGSRDATGKPHFAGGAVSCALAFLKEKDKGTPPVLDFLTGSDGIVAQAIEFLPAESWDHHRIWPLGGIYLNGKSYIYYSLIEIGEGTWNFKGVGSGLASAVQPLSIHDRIQTDQGWRFPVEPACVVAAGDWVYLYEVQERGDRHRLWLSRVRPAEIENPKAYQFQCGPGAAFSRDKSQQVPLMTKDIYGQASVVWNEYLQKYILASSSSFFGPREIRFHTADEPFGPWTDAVASVTTPEHLQQKKVELVYCSYFHPEFFRENGRIMNLTFSPHLKDSGFDANNEMVEVEIIK